MYAPLDLLAFVAVGERFGTVCAWCMRRLDNFVCPGECQAVLRIHQGTSDLFRPGRTDHRRHPGALWPDKYFVISRNDRIVFVFYIRTFRFIGDREPHLRMPRTLTKLATLVVKPVLAITRDQTGVVHEMTIKQILVVAVCERWVGCELLPWTVGRIGNRDPDF